jgi:PKHD-type hydroxylase
MNLLRINKEIKPIDWVDNFLSNEEIDKILKYAEQINPEPAKVGGNVQEEEKKPFTPDYHIKNTNIGDVPRMRQSILKWIELNPNTSWLYKKLISQIHKVNQENFDYILKFVENLQLTEYNENQQGFYLKHNDSGLASKLENFVDIRKLSFTIQLTNPEEYEGGELILYVNNQQPFTAPKTKGTIIFFESNIQHEVKPVKKGIRHALVSWVQGPNLR